jgi:glutathione synthase/RimK-type ligase-like ATP-grasp enzyme
MTALAPPAAETDVARTAAAERPAVLFADVEPWEAFLQLAAALRRRGVRVHRVTAADRSRVRRVNDAFQRLVFHRTRPVLPRAATAAELGSRVLAELPAGIRAVEAVDEVAAALTGLPGVPTRTASPELERLLSDKQLMGEHAAAAGLAVPPSWPAESDHPLRPPFILKPRLGSGGGGVLLVSDERTAAAVAERARHQPGTLLAQEWAPGELLHVAGVARRGALLQAACYRADGSPHAAHGPSATVVTVDDRDALTQAGELLAGLRYTGAFCLDYVRASDGRPLLIDVNARIFGSWLALQVAGLDIVGAYAYAWGLSDRPPAGAVAPGRRLRVLAPDKALTGFLPAAVGRELAVVLGSGRVLGVRWVVAAVARLVSAAAVQVARRGGARR